MMIFNAIEALVLYGIQTGLIDHNESVYTRNRLLDVLHEDGFEAAEPMKGTLPDILKVLTDHAVQKGLCADTSESRDIYDTRLMNCLTPRPGEVNRRFFALYAQSRQAATDWFYRFSGDVNYIRRDRIARDRRWKVQSEYGEIDITINLSKPEKDPRDIAAAGKAKTTAYPLCQLCVENVGYAGRIGHPARANHRVLPIDICGEEWFFQYSPYVYYNEHCIVFNGDHIPMVISKKAFEKLFDFVRQFPHYFVGSNADLPIVGGSILSHEHFQGGRYTFAMERAESEYCFAVKGYEDIACGIVKWPLSVIRLRGCDSGRLVELAAMILDKWRGYTDESERHHIKKENIGLIEVMGLAVLPSRLQKELELLEAFIAEGRDIAGEASIAKHADWANSFAEGLKGQPREVIREILEKEVGKVFLHVLEDAGVFKRDKKGKAAFLRFIESLSE